MPRSNRLRAFVRGRCCLLAVAAFATATACASHGPAVAAPESGEASVFRSGDNIAGKFLAGRQAERLGDYETAITLTLDVLDARPDDDKLLGHTHLLLISAGRMDEAVPLAERLVARDESDTLANMTLSIAALKAARYDDVLVHLDRLRLEGANRYLVPLLRAWTLAGKGDAANARAALDAFNATAGLSVLSGLHGGMIDELLGDDAAAAVNYERAAAAAGDRMSLQFMRSYTRFLARTGKAEQAKQLTADFAADNPGNLLVEPMLAAFEKGALPDSLAPTAQAGAAQALREIAQTLHQENIDNSALVFIHFALYLKPGDSWMQSLLANILNSQGRNEAALAELRRIDPNSAYSWYAGLDIANTLRALDRTDEAIAHLEDMVDRRPERADAARVLGDFLRYDERYAEAVKAYDMAIERTADDPDWRLYYARGIALERLKDWPPAEKDFLRALELEPDQPLVLNYLGYSWVEYGRNLDRAKAMIEKAVELRPRDGYITDSLGWVLYRLGDYDGAVQWLERAVALEPGDATINDHLGDAYWLVGRHLEAGFQWNRALSLEPEADLEEKIRRKIGGEDRPKPLPPGERRDI